MTVFPSLTRPMRLTPAGDERCARAAGPPQLWSLRSEVTQAPQSSTCLQFTPTLGRRQLVRLSVWVRYKLKGQ